MSEFATLNEMGINNPDEIDRYSYEAINNIDILRIVYKRKKGSLLPSSKRFRFNRIEEVNLVEGDVRSTEIHYKSSPVLRKALSELDMIVNSKKDRRSQFEVIEDELRRLKEDNAVRHSYIESLIKALK